MVGVRVRVGAIRLTFITGAIVAGVNVVHSLHYLLGDTKFEIETLEKFTVKAYGQMLINFLFRIRSE